MRRAPYGDQIMPNLVGHKGRREPANISAERIEEATGVPQTDVCPDESEPRNTEPNAICNSLIHDTAPLIFALSPITGALPCIRTD